MKQTNYTNEKSSSSSSSPSPSLASSASPIISGADSRVDENRFIENQLFTIPIDSQNNAQAGEFQRIEEKYLVPLTEKNKILTFLHEKMDLTFLEANTQFTLIESLYFDSAQFDFYQHHFSLMPERHKLRIRRYAPNGIWSEGPSQLELKTKKEGQSKKFRFMISHQMIEQLKQGLEIPYNAELLEINKKIPVEKLLKRVTKVNELIRLYSLKPVIAIHYHRLAFEKNGLRVTLDENLSAESKIDFSRQLSSHQSLDCLNNRAFIEKADELWKRFNVDQFVVLEVKHQGYIPAWLFEMLSQLNLEKTSFSKYSWFLTNQLRPFMPSALRQ